MLNNPFIGENTLQYLSIKGIIMKLLDQNEMEQARASMRKEIKENYYTNYSERDRRDFRNFAAANFPGDKFFE